MVLMGSMGLIPSHLYCFLFPARGNSDTRRFGNGINLYHAGYLRRRVFYRGEIFMRKGKMLSYLIFGALAATGILGGVLLPQKSLR